MERLLDMPAEDFRATCVHEAAHAVIGRVLGYDITAITVEPTEQLLGRVSARRWANPLAHMRSLGACYSLAGIVAEERVREDFYASDYLNAHVVGNDGQLHVLDNVGRSWGSSPSRDDDLQTAWSDVGRDWEGLIAALDRTYAAVHAAWRRIDAVARHLASVRTVTDGGNRARLRALLHGRGGRWYHRTFCALHGR